MTNTENLSTRAKEDNNNDSYVETEPDLDASSSLQLIQDHQASIDRRLYSRQGKKRISS